MRSSTRLNLKNPTKKITQSDDGSLSIFHCISYALPKVATIWLWAPTAILQGIYAKYYGFSLTLLASVVLIARIFDVITDPMIGYLSDRYVCKSGTRKPFVLLGGVLLIVSSYFLYVPYGVDASSVELARDGQGPLVGEAYFIVWFLLFYLSFTLFEIPHVSWGSEISSSSESKSRLFSFRTGFGYVGLILFYSIPMLPVFETSDITPETLEVSVLVVSILMVLFLYFCLKYTPNSGCELIDNVSVGNEQRPTGRQIGVKDVYKSVVSNRPLLIFLSSFLFSGVGSGLWYGIIFLYVDSYLNMGDQFAPMFLLSFLIGLLSTPFWYRLSLYYGKKVVLLLASFLLVVSFIYSGLLNPGYTTVAALIVLKVINSVGNVCFSSVAPAVLSEIVDYSTWKYRDKKTGMYFSIYSFIQKINVAMGMAIGLAVIGWYGYDATNTKQSVGAIHGMMMVMVWIPSLLTIVSMIIIFFIPINSRRHQVIRRRLESQGYRRNSI